MEKNPNLLESESIEIECKDAKMATPLIDLYANMTYYVKAFLVYEADTGYSKELEIKTLGITLGMEHEGGIVVYILKEGDPGYDPLIQHGLIVSKFDISEQFYFGCSAIWEAYQMAIGTGKANTEALLEEGCEINHAAKICADHESEGFSDWHLPCLLEMNEIRNNCHLIPHYKITDFYWSSTTLTSKNWAFFVSVESASATFRYSKGYVIPTRYF